MSKPVNPRFGEIASFQRLAHLNWRILIGHSPLHGIVETHVGRLAGRNADLRSALDRWMELARASGDSPASDDNFHDASRTLARILRPADRFAETALALRAASERVLRRQPGLAAAAHLHAVRYVGDQFVEARNHLVQAHLGLVHSAARKLERTGDAYDDIVHEGVFGLMRALECYDPAHGTRFSTYAMYWIRTSMVKAQAAMTRQIRVPRHVLEHRRAFALELAQLGTDVPEESHREAARDAAGLTERQLRNVESVLDPSARTPLREDFPAQESDPDMDLDLKLLRSKLQGTLPALDDREATILAHRYELGGAPFRTLAELGQQFGFSRERIRQIQARTLRKLRDSMASTAEVSGGTTAAA